MQRVFLISVLMFGGCMQKQSSTPVAAEPAAAEGGEADETSPDADREWTQEELEAERERLLNMPGLPPLAWPDDTPDQYRAEGYLAVINEVLETCQPDVEYLGMDCEEPPCMAAFRVKSPDSDEWTAKLNKCPAFTEKYKSPEESGSMTYDCPDGSSGSIAFLAPRMSHLVDDPADTSQDPKCWIQYEEEGQRMARASGEPGCGVNPRMGWRKYSAYRPLPIQPTGFAWEKVCLGE